MGVYIGIMEKKMETAIMGYIGLWVYGGIANISVVDSRILRRFSILSDESWCLRSCMEGLPSLHPLPKSFQNPDICKRFCVCAMAHKVKKLINQWEAIISKHRK